MSAIINGGGGGGGLPAHLSYSDPTLTVSASTFGNGQLALSGNTSGTATFTAPAVAGTATNGVTMTNVLYGPNGTLAAPTYSFTNCNGCGLMYDGSQVRSVQASAAGFTFGTSATTWATIDNNGITGVNTIGTNKYATGTNCTSSASPAVCGTAAAGSVVIAAAATTVQVNTSAVTANSQIFVQEDSSLGTKLSVTCNTQAQSALGTPTVTARVGNTSFTISIAAGPTTNPACYSYFIVN